MSHKLRVGVVGVGFLGQHHARLLAGMDNVSLAGVVDIDQSRATEIAARYRTRAFTEASTLLPEVDAVTIATPTVTHIDIAMPFVDAGVAVLIEKPLASGVGDADRLLDAAARRGTLVADLSDSDLGRIYELRSVLEPQAASLAAERGTDEQRVALADVIGQMRSELARPKPDRRLLIALDRDLHRLIWAMAGNEMLEQTLEWLFSHVLRRWNVSIDRAESLGTAMELHEAIAAAIIAGQSTQANKAMARHVAGFQASLVS